MSRIEAIRTKFYESLGPQADLAVGLLGRARDRDVDATRELQALIHRLKGEAQLLTLPTGARLLHAMDAILKGCVGEPMSDSDGDALMEGITALRTMGQRGESDAAVESATTRLTARSNTPS